MDQLQVAPIPNIPNKAREQRAVTVSSDNTQIVSVRPPGGYYINVGEGQ